MFFQVGRELEIEFITDNKNLFLNDEEIKKYCN